MSVPSPKSVQRESSGNGSEGAGESSPAVQIGSVVDVRGSTVVVEITGPHAASLQIGELLSMVGFSLIILGEVLSVQRSDKTIAELSLVASLDLKAALLTPGIHEVPGVGAPVHRPPVDIIRAVYEDRRNLRGGKSAPIQLEMATSQRYRKLSLSFTPEKLFGRHLAIVGTSGGGKSCSVARLIEQCAAHQSKIVLVDLTGEYETLTGPVFHVHLGSAVRDKVPSSATSIPFYELTEADLVSILEPETPLQLAKLRAAIKTLKLLQLEPRLGAEGTFAKAHKEKRAYDQSMDDFRNDVEAPENMFDIYRLPLQIQYECVDTHRSQSEANFWGPTNNEELAACAGLIHRTEEILRMGEMAKIFLPNGTPSLIATMDSFLKDGSFSVLRISFEFVPPLHNVREIVANAIARRLLKLGRERFLMSRPTLLILDEAHQVLRSAPSRFSRDFPLDAFNLIAKEGRKYGLCLGIATQRPGDIPEDVLSQVGTFIVHRLVGSTDRGMIERASGACDRELLEDLPALAAGEAFMLGIEFSRPIRVRITLPLAMPRSHGPNYQELWRKQ